MDATGDEVMIERLTIDIQRIHTSTNNNTQATNDAGQQTIEATAKIEVNDATMKGVACQGDRDLTSRIEEALTQVGRAVEQANTAYSRTETCMTELSKEASKVSEAKV